MMKKNVEKVIMTLIALVIICSITNSYTDEINEIFDFAPFIDWVGTIASVLMLMTLRMIDRITGRLNNKE